MDYRTESSAANAGKRDSLHAVNGAAALAPGACSASTFGIEVKPAVAASDRPRVAADASDNPKLVAPMLRAGSLAIFAFQIIYTVLDRNAYPHSFAAALPVHIASIAIGLIAVVATVSPAAMRHWRPFALALCSSSLAMTAWIAVLSSDSDVLVASILMVFFGAGALIPWNPLWQAALEASGMLALAAYSLCTPTPDTSLPVAWTIVISALALAQTTAIHAGRYRQWLADRIAALAENDRLLRHEMKLHAEIAAARDHDHARLQASESMLRKVFDASPENIAINCLADGRFITVNDKYQVAGYTRDDVLGTSVIALGTWPHVAELRRFLDCIRDTGRVNNMEITQRRKDGAESTNLISASVVEVDGEPCVISMTRDITEIKRVEIRLRDSLAALRKIFDANLDSMTLSGVDGTCLDVNQQFINATGFSREEAVGHHFADLNLWIHPDEMIAFADQLGRTNEVRNLEVAFRMKDGSEQPVLLSAVNLDLYGQVCCLTISRGVADIKMTQRELVAAREAALAASRAKSEFLSSMSHEIRTPMNSILGMADLLMETELGDEQRRYLSTVISNGHALLALINSILDLAKVESGRISLEAVEFNLRDVAEKVLETLAIRADEKGLDLMVRFAPEVPELALGDPLRLSQILINLVGNAIKFTHQGQVLVTVEGDPDSTRAASSAVGLKFTVTDTGIGIPADKRHLLFKPFSQADSSTSRKYGGSGLGLAIVSRLVALMHGRVTVESEPGTGSAFSFTAQFAAAAAPARSESSGRELAGTRVLLIDDSADARSIVSDLLTARGADVTQASSAAGALAELRSDGARDSHFQVVLLDRAMPAPGSFEVAEYLTGGAPGHARIVMMVGTRDLALEVARLRAIGIDNYIVKPVRRAELFAAVARARAGEPVPMRSDPLVRPAIALSSAQSAVLDRPLQILLADDSNDNRALIRAYLKKTPYRLDEAEDGRQAIAKFVAGKFDVVLMDIQMPNIDGYEATAAIRDWERANNRPHTPILALTASALDDAMLRTKVAGCDAHVTKPVRKATLLEAIRDAVENITLDDGRENVATLKEETCRTE